MKKALFFLIILSFTFGCSKDESYKQTLQDPELFQSAMKQLTDVIVYDIFSPPVASRVYAYPNIAAFEVMAKAFPEKYESLSSQITDFGSIPDPKPDVNLHLAGLHAFMIVGKALIFSEDKMESFIQSIYEKLESQGLSRSEKEASLSYGEEVAGFVLSWADKDMYKQTRTFSKYTVEEEVEKWKPTPPDYMSGIEPHWKEIRPLVIDSANQFIPKDPEDFDMNEGSEFHRQLIEVYEIGKNLDDEQKQIAEFWDCNPYVSHHRGHAMFATKKITPGGHWMGIVAIATRQSNNTFDETIEAYTRTSIALFDGFISCWDEKWRSIVVRPETLINEYLDEEWAPLLQTPPFPEYTSGHSVISRAAAITLTDYYGDGFAFNDTTEVEYGLPERQFESFLQASEEAAISRLYGGIHYMMAIDNGVDQGEEVGKFVVANLKTRK